VIRVAAVNAARRVGRRAVGRSMLGYVGVMRVWIGVPFSWIDDVLMRMLGGVRSGLVDAVFVSGTL
jgi:hypothetical protein